MKSRNKVSEKWPKSGQKVNLEQPYCRTNRVVRSSHFLTTFQLTFQLLFVISAVKDIKVNLKSSQKVAKKCYFETWNEKKWNKSKSFLLFTGIPMAQQVFGMPLWHVIHLDHVLGVWVPDVNHDINMASTGFCSLSPSPAYPTPCPSPTQWKWQ